MTQSRDQDVIVEHLIGYLLKNDETIARDYETTASALEGRANALRERAARRRRKKNNRFHHIATIRQIEPVYARAQAEGVSDTVSHVATTLGIPCEIVDVWVAYFAKEDAPCDQESCTIIDMAEHGASTGHSRNEIGARVGMHFRSAQRLGRAQYGDEKVWSIISADRCVSTDR